LREIYAKAYSNILPFLLAANGAKPRSAPINPNSDIKIGNIANGHVVAAVTNASIDAQAGAITTRRYSKQCACDCLQRHDRAC
jgi:hypothetical protein